MKSLISLVTLLNVTCLSSNLALAHRAISANYETDKVGTIDGVVVENWFEELKRLAPPTE